jgi:hypothetical protein
LPRAATVASVLDRGVSDKAGRLTLEQAKMVIADTLVAVGGTEVGVLDESGNQLNPKIEGAGALSVTPVGVERQAKALIAGDVYTLKEFVWALQESFNFVTPPSIQSVLTILQEAVNQAWANPADPRWSMAIVIFNEGPTLSSTPPMLTPDTRINRFQGFLLMSSFLLNNLQPLDSSAEQMLDANGVDWRSTMPGTQSAQLAAPRVAAPAGALGVANALVPRVAVAVQTQSSVAGDLMGRQTFTNMWKVTKGSLIVESLKGSLAVFQTTQAIHSAMGWLLGSSGGLTGAVTGLALATTMSFAGFLTIAFYKVVLTWFVALAVASFEPLASTVDHVQLDELGNLVITAERSPSEIGTLRGRGPSGINNEEIGYTYQLYRFPNCIDTALKEAQWMAIGAEPVLSDPDNAEDPPLGKLQFVIPRAKLRRGANHFRVVTFQYIHNANKKLIEGVEDHDTDGDKKLSLQEFLFKGLGNYIDFGKFDVNHDQQLDTTEYKRQAVVGNFAAEALGRDSNDDDLPFAEPVSMSAANYSLTEQSEERRLQAQEEAARQTEPLEAQKQQAGRRTLITQRWEVDYDVTLDEKAEFRAKFGEEAGATKQRLFLSDNVAFGNIKGGPQSFDDPASDVNRDFMRIFGREATPEETRQMKAVAQNKVNWLQQRTVVDQTLQGNKQLLQLREQVRTVHVPDGQTRQVTGTYITEEGGQVVTKSVTIEVRADARGEAVARVNSILSTNEQTVTNPKLNDWGVAGNRLNSSVRGMYSVEFREAEAAAAARQGARIPTQQAQAQRSFLGGKNLKRIGAQQARRTRCVGGGMSLAPHSYGAFSATSNLGVAIVGQLGTIGAFLNAIQTLPSAPGPCVPYENSGIPVPTEQFPPSIVPHPNQEEVGSVLRAKKDEANAKGGFLERQYPLSDPAIEQTEAGFPPAFLTTDKMGRVYADNRNSNVPYGGRLFRFTPARPPGGVMGTSGTVPLSMPREFVGAVNYYSLELQMGRPAYPAAMVAGPPFWDLGENLLQIETQDLFVADIDVVDGITRVLRVPVSLIDTHPSVYYEASGNRQHLVGQSYVKSAEFRFTGPSDMEVGPSFSTAAPLPGADGVIMLSDENAIFAMYGQVLGGQPQLRHVIRIPNRRWSGLAFDRAGKFYFADYFRGEVWVMTWDRLRNLITSDSPLSDDAALASQAYLLVDGLEQPGDIEIEQGSSAHPGRSLFVSHFWGVDKHPLPIAGRLATPVKEMKIKRLQKEEDVHILADGVSFYVEPSYDDLATREAWLRVLKTDPETGGDKWGESLVILAEHGATLLEGFAP